MAVPGIARQATGAGNTSTDTGTPQTLTCTILIIATRQQQGRAAMNLMGATQMEWI